jgi:hypothetical protein
MEQEKDTFWHIWINYKKGTGSTYANDPDGLTKAKKYVEKEYLRFGINKVTFTHQELNDGKFIKLGEPIVVTRENLTQFLAS